MRVGCWAGQLGSLENALGYLKDSHIHFDCSGDSVIAGHEFSLP